METLEKRQPPRENCLMIVDFACEDKAYTEFIRNISKGGMNIDSHVFIPIGNGLTLTFQYPQQGPVKRIGKVVRTDAGVMGIQLR
jgi:hypothetical protein